MSEQKQLMLWEGEAIPESRIKALTKIEKEAWQRCSRSASRNLC